MKRRTGIVLVVSLLAVIFIGALYDFASRTFLRFILDESWQSETRSAFIVLVTRYGQQVREGVIVGEANSTRESYLPTWRYPLRYPSSLDCSLEIDFPKINGTTEDTMHFRSDRLLVVGPTPGTHSGREVIAVIYEGSGIDFSEIIKSDGIESLYNSGATGISDSVLSNKSATKGAFTRGDKIALYSNAILGRNVTTETVECSVFLFTYFEFDTPNWRIN